MRIGIDCRLYGTYHRGIGRYAERLVLELAKQSDDHHYVLFVTSETAGSLSLSPSRFTVVRADVPHYGFREHVLMPGLILRSRVELFHGTHLNVPYWCPVPYVVTIHDLIVFHFPDTRASTHTAWQYRLKLWGYRAVLSNAVRKAKKIIAVSEYTKRDIVRHLSVPEERIAVVYPGVEEMLLGTDVMRNTPQFEALLAEKFKITKPYLLYVGSAYPHKNLERLVDAYALLRARHRRNWQLVLVGRIDSFYRSLISYADRAVPDPHQRRDIIFTGAVSDRELDGVYRGAKCFAFPSRYEGFGLPPIEAARRGVPVVCSRAASLPEVLADGARYFDPDDTESITSALDAVGGLHTLHRELSERGVRRAKLFSWEKMARETVAVYRESVV